MEPTTSMQKQYLQQTLPFFESENHHLPSVVPKSSARSNNAIRSEDQAFHAWYRFVLSYPPHLVRDYIRDFALSNESTVLDPFCGTGTTVVEAKLNGISAIGLEANPFPHFAATVKSDWRIDPDELENVATTIAESTYESLLKQGIDDRSLTCLPSARLEELQPQAMRALIKNSISPLPLHKSLVLIEQISAYKDTAAHRYCTLAMGNALVSSIGNLRFGPEVGVGKVKRDAPVVSIWMHEIRKMVKDLRTIQGKSFPDAVVHLADARKLTQFISPNSIDAVITSPPYPNEKDYTRTTRLESVVLGYFENMSHLREFKKTLLRSNTRGVYKADDDDLWVAGNEHIQRLAEEIEARRIELGKTSGFEKMYARVTKLYFGGMTRHLTELTTVLKPGARLAYVVGDQASYLKIMIRTGQILAEIAEQIGYEIERIDLFRTRFASATQSELREEVLILRWPGVRS
jgi:DNA modification methylase